MDREIPRAGLRISAIGFGTWPLAGMTSGAVPEQTCIRMIEACPELGINFLDTAYGYGLRGESELLIGKALAGRAHEYVVASKAGLEWNEQGKRIIDGRETTLRRHCEASLTRLGLERIDLLYLHQPDPGVDIQDSAHALSNLQQEGKARSIGLSNCTLAQLIAFDRVCPVAAVQIPYNMLTRDSARELISWCGAHGVAICSYWALMKGLLAGRMSRDHQFVDTDSRRNYDAYRGEAWQQNLDLVDELRTVAQAAHLTVAQLVLRWTLHQPGITSVMVGAKNPEQLVENAGALGDPLSPPMRSAIERVLQDRVPLQ